MIVDTSDGRTPDRSAATGRPVGPDAAVPTPRSVLAVSPLPAVPGLRLVGEVDLSTRPALSAALDTVNADQDVHLDLADVTFVDVGGAAILVTTAQRLRPDHRLVLHDPPDPLRRIISLLWGHPPAIEIPGV